MFNDFEQSTCIENKQEPCGTPYFVWNLVDVLPLMISTAKKGMVENIEKVSKRATVTEIQKICMLGSVQILKKVLRI